MGHCSSENLEKDVPMRRAVKEHYSLGEQLVQSTRHQRKLSIFRELATMIIVGISHAVRQAWARG